MPALFDGKPELPAFGVPVIVGGVAVLLALEVPPADELLAAEEDDMVVPEAPGVVGVLGASSKCGYFPNAKRG